MLVRNASDQVVKHRLFESNLSVAPAALTYPVPKVVGTFLLGSRCISPPPWMPLKVEECLSGDCLWKNIPFPADFVNQPVQGTPNDFSVVRADIAVFPVHVVSGGQSRRTNSASMPLKAAIISRSFFCAGIRECRCGKFSGDHAPRHGSNPGAALRTRFHNSSRWRQPQEADQLFFGEEN